MNKSAKQAAADVEVVLYMVDNQKISKAIKKPEANAK